MSDHYTFHFPEINRPGDGMSHPPRITDRAHLTIQVSAYESVQLERGVWEYQPISYEQAHEMAQQHWAAIQRVKERRP